MRDANRLYNFYSKLTGYHKTYVPDWRFGQMMENFRQWLQNTHKIDDMFYLEEDKFLQLFDEFISSFIDIERVIV